MTVLDDQDYADDIGLHSSKHQQKAERLSKTANAIGLKVNTKKTKVQRKNTGVNDPVMVDGKHIEDVDNFTYLGTRVTTIGYYDQEMNTGIRKDCPGFAMLKLV